MKTTIALRFNKQHTKANGRAQLYLLIGIDKQFDRLPLNLDWEPHLIDTNNNQLIGRSARDKECNDYNLLIRKAIGKANDIFVEYRLREKVLTLERFFDIYKDFENLKDFIFYMEEKIQERYKRKKISEGTRNSHVNTLLWLRDFRPVITFRELDRKLIERFEAFLQRAKNKRSKDGKLLDPNTIANILKYTKAYIELAITDEFPITNPFSTADVKINQDKKQIEHLLPQNVAQLMNHYESDMSIGEKLTLCRFLIACTLSMRISDILKIDGQQLEYYRKARKIIFHPKKQVITKKLKTIYVAIEDEALQYLEDCVALQQQAREAGLNISEAYGRKTLKKIAGKLGLKIAGFHMGRHSFATNYLRAGGKVTNLQHIMGHTNINTTMMYVHIVEEDTEEEMVQLSNMYQRHRIANKA